jgi:peptidoglycan/LPS O-acetylase OafA/YrhL
VSSGLTASGGRRLLDIEVVRILTFASVILVHTTTVTAPRGDVGLNALVILLHFTREVFFMLTAFVLLRSELRRPTPLRRALPRRFLLVGVPYLVWSAVYVALPDAWGGHLLERWPQDLAAFGLDVLTGSAWYHLYFLLVTMQIYLLVPAIAWLVRRTRGHHALVLVVAFVLQAGFAAILQYSVFGDLGWYGTAAKRFVWSYPFVILAGAIVADHAEAFFGWVRSHLRLIALAFVGGGVLTVGVFLVNLDVLGQTAGNASKPLQPVVLLWSVCVVLAFVAVGGLIADATDPASRLQRAIYRISDRSFGVFLVHPLFIWLLLRVGGKWVPETIPAPWLTFAVFAAAVLASYVVADLARRTPLSLPLTGRRRRT